MAIRTLEQLLATEQLTDPTCDVGSIAYQRLHACVSCHKCGGFGVLSKTGGSPRGDRLTSYRAHYAHDGDMGAAAVKAGLKLCECRLNAIEFMVAISEHTKGQLVMPTATYRQG